MPAQSNSINIADLINATHSDLYQARFKYPDQTSQQMLAPYEHRAFAREFAQESPALAAVSLPFAIPAYAMYKTLGLSQSRSGPSLEQVKQGYLGLHEGLKAALFGKP